MMFANKHIWNIQQIEKFPSAEIDKQPLRLDRVNLFLVPKIVKTKIWKMFKCLPTCKCSISNDSFKVVQFSGTSVTYENFRFVAFLPVHNKKITIFINISFRSHSKAMHAVKCKYNSSESFLNFHEKCERVHWGM